jgi:hypothetical protein
MKYSYQGVQFGSYLAKEHWILEMNIRNLEWVVAYGKIQDRGRMEHLVATVKRMKQRWLHETIINFLFLRGCNRNF